MEPRFWCKCGLPSEMEAPLDHNDRATMYIGEAGLYTLSFRATAPFAEEFTDYVCRKVLPPIRKYRHYTTNEEALVRILNPRGESALHYRRRAHKIKKAVSCFQHICIIWRESNKKHCLCGQIAN